MSKLADYIDSLLYPFFQETKLSDDNLYTLLGTTILGGLSLRLTTVRLFEPNKMKIVGANRTRYRDTLHAGESVRLTRTKLTNAWGYPVTYFNRNPPKSFSSSTTTAVFNKGTVALSKDFMNDTTKSTRKQPSGEVALNGEAEYSDFKLFSQPRTTGFMTRHIATYLDIVGVGVQSSFNESFQEINVSPVSGYLDEASLVILRNTESSTLDNHLSQSGFSLLAQALPSHRDMNLFRSIAELRDFPRTVKSAMESLMSINKNITAKRIGSDYLTLEFGIAPVIDDVKKLLKVVHSVPRRVAYLQRRHLQDTTFHAERKFIEHGGSTALAIPYDLSYEPRTSIGTLNDRLVTLRATVNCNVRFPDIEAGLPRTFDFAKLIGLNPTIGDLYALMPWTWLIDWFAGLGEYMNILIQFNSEPSVINWGMVSAKAELSLSTTSDHKYQTQVTRKQGTTVLEKYTMTRKLSYCSAAKLVTYKRVSASSLAELPTTSTLSGLSSWQASILSALYASKYA